jgi:hypothetical protein
VLRVDDFFVLTIVWDRYYHRPLGPLYATLQLSLVLLVIDCECSPFFNLFVQQLIEECSIVVVKTLEASPKWAEPVSAGRNSSSERKSRVHLGLLNWHRLVECEPDARPDFESNHKGIVVGQKDWRSVDEGSFDHFKDANPSR